jgi:glycosyltransferase involved in cell wall biosynthesis
MSVNLKYLQTEVQNTIFDKSLPGVQGWLSPGEKQAHSTPRGPHDPTVSVILPTYNRAHTVVRAILSVLNQTYQDLELIIVDDASTDDTRQVVAGFDDERIKYIRHEDNRGAAAARNTGIRASRGTYVAFQDSDDEWLPGKLERQVKAFEEASPEIGVVYSSFWLIRERRRSLRPSRIRKLSAILPSKTRRLEGAIYHALLRGNFVTTHAVVRRECFDRAGPFDERLPRLQDWELWLRISKHYQFKHIDDPLVLVYHTPDSISADRSAIARAFELILEKHRETLQESAEFLAQYSYAMGDIACWSGELERGQSYLFRAVRLRPFNVMYWIAACASLLGCSAYTRIVKAIGTSYAT